MHERREGGREGRDIGGKNRGEESREEGSRGEKVAMKRGGGEKTWGGRNV